MNLSLKKAAYIVSFFTLASVFALLYYAGYYYATSNHIGSSNLITKEEVASSNPSMKNTDTMQEVVSEAEQIITTDTKYIEEHYNSDTGELTKQAKDMPIELLGLNRSQVIDYLTTFKSSNAEESIVNIQLVAFSGEQVIIRKTIRDINELYHYYVVCENEIIKIYHSDKKTLFVDTGIDISNIDDEYKVALRNGFYIETVHELYNYLESITS